MSASIQVGANKESILAARQAILDILNTDRDESTIKKALTIFASVTSVHGTTIRDSQFYMNTAIPAIDSAVQETFPAGGIRDNTVTASAR